MWCDITTTAHRAAVGTSSTAVANLRTSTSPPTPAWGRRGTRLTRYACRMARRRGVRHTTLTGHRSHHLHEPSPRVNVDEAEGGDCRCRALMGCRLPARVSAR